MIVVAAVMAVDVNASSDWDSEAQKRKANYIFLEAVNQYELGNFGSFYSLINRAYNLDPTDTQIGYEKGMFDIALSQNDSIEFFKAYALVKKHFDAHPEDYYPSLSYGLINSKIGLRDEALRVWSTLDSIFPNKTNIAMQYADALSASVDSAEIAQAVAIYNRVEVAEGKDMGLTSRKIRAYSAIKDTVSIIAELDSLIASSPNSSEYHVFAGDIYNFFGDDESTLNYYNKAIELDPSNGNAFYRRAIYYNEIGDSVAYDLEVFNALVHDDLDLDAKLQLLTQYIRTLYSDPAQQSRIEELLSKLLEQHPHQYEIHELYSAYLSTIKDFPRAAEQMSYALDINPSNDEAWSQYIALCAQTEDKAQIIDAVERALYYFPEKPILIYQAGVTYFSVEEPQKALECYNKALPLSDFSSEFKSDILCSIADLYQNSEQLDSAFTYYGRSIEANPDNLLALNNYAYYLAVNNRDLDKAERMSARTVLEEPENVNSLDTYAWIFFKKKKYDLAQQQIDKALEIITEPSAELYHHAGDIYFMCGDPKKAVEFWEKALELDPNNELLIKKVKHKTYFYE